MSFSVTYIGKPDAIKRAMQKSSEQMSGGNKQEFDDVRPALELILDQNVGSNGVLRLDANGHATFVNGTKTFGACSVSVSQLGQLAE